MLSKFQKFTTRRIKRIELINAPYNPRTIDDFSRAKLRRVLAKRGLLNALVWNERTGHLVSGHQRISLLDDLEGSQDYELDVNVIDLTEKQEKEIVVSFNNQAVMGTWDVLKLGELLTDPELNLDNTGFDPLELSVIFEGTEYENAFLPASDEKVTEDLQELEEIAEKGRLENGDVIEDEEKLEAVKEEREKMREKMEAVKDASMTDYYAVVVCGSGEELRKLLEGLGENPSSKYIDGRKLMHKLSIL